MSCSLARELTWTDLGFVLGIDLGTTNSCAAVFRNGQLIDIISSNGNSLFPSAVTILNERSGMHGYALDTEAGDVAAQKAKDDFEVYKRTLFATKRLIGRSADDPILKDDLKRWPYQVVDDNNGQGRIRLPNVNTDISPEYAAAELLKLIRRTAENKFGCLITRVVIAVPAYFTSTQRRATQLAAEVIGLKVLKLITEPTAAALNYAIQPGHAQTDGHLLVYDLGGGTFDVSVLEVKQNVFRVLATGGDPHLGGDDLDGALMNYVVDKVIPSLIKAQSGAATPSDSDSDSDDQSPATQNKVNIAQMWSTISADPQKRGLFNRQLRYAVREFKHQFSNNPRVKFNHTLCGLPIHFALSRAQFNQLICKAFIDKTLSHVHKALGAAKLTPQQITKVLLVGGSTRLPCVKESLVPLFGVNKICDAVDVDLAVGRGAAVQAALLSRNKEQSLTNVVLSDITTWNLGVEVATGELSVLIPKHSTLPSSKTGPYENAFDNQSAITLPIYEGDNLDKAAANQLLGSVRIDLGRAYKKGEAKINVTFEASTNGLLQVTAQTADTKKKVSAEFEWKGQLDPGEQELLQRNNEYERRVLPVKNQATRDMNAIIEICHKLDKALAKGHVFKSTVLSPNDLSRIKQTIDFAKRVEQWLLKQHPYDQHVQKEDYIDRHLALSLAFGMEKIELEVKNIP